MFALHLIIIFPSIWKFHYFYNHYHNTLLIAVITIAEFMMLLIPLMTSHNFILHTPLLQLNVEFLFRVSSIGKTNFYPWQMPISLFQKRERIWRCSNILTIYIINQGMRVICSGRPKHTTHISLNRSQDMRFRVGNILGRQEGGKKQSDIRMRGKFTFFYFYC